MDVKVTSLMDPSELTLLDRLPTLACMRCGRQSSQNIKEWHSNVWHEG
jgi:hypothetical protein